MKLILMVNSDYSCNNASSVETGAGKGHVAVCFAKSARASQLLWLLGSVRRGKMLLLGASAAQAATGCKLKNS